MDTAPTFEKKPLSNLRYWYQHVQKSTLIALSMAVLSVVVVGTALVTYNDWKILPESVDYRSGGISFTFARGYLLEEYGRSDIRVGSSTNSRFTALVEVITYQNDPDVARPSTFSAFMEHQATSLCGTDNGLESVMCTITVNDPITTKTGMEGKKLSLLLTRRSLLTGTVSTTTYGPIYAFDTTEATGPEEALRYRATFIYPSFTPFLQGTTDTQLMDSIIGTVAIARLAPTVTLETAAGSY